MATTRGSIALQVSIYHSESLCVRSMALSPNTIPLRTTCTLFDLSIWLVPLLILIKVVELLEKNATFLNQNPKCEARLGKRGLFSKTSSGEISGKSLEMAMLWVLNLSDGTNTLLDIAARSGINFGNIVVAAEALQKAQLLAPKQV